MAEGTPANSDRTTRMRGAKSQSVASKRLSRATKVLIWVAFVVVAVLGVYKSGLLDSVMRPLRSSIPSISNMPIVGSLFSDNAGSTDSLRVMGAVFSNDAADDLFSEIAVLRSVGESPDEPSRVLFRAFKAPEVQQREKEQKAQQPATVPESSTPESSTQAKLTKAEQPKTESQPEILVTAAKTAPKQAPTPVITTKEPSEEVAIKQESPARSTASVKPQLAKRSNKKPITVPDRFPPPSVNQDTKNAAKGEKNISSIVPLEEDSLARKSNTPDSNGEHQEYQLPGSLRVSIKNYKGTKVRWNLMVILDDSSSMGRKSKAWSSSRIDSARKFVEKMAGSLAQGSRIAVRDFYCSRGSGNKKRRHRSCLSHMLQDWAEPPFVGLKASLLKADPVGRTNPCAAAAYSLKRDFEPGATLHPRIVLITAAATKCRSTDVLKVINRKWGDERPNIDVIGIGMSRKRQAGYRNLAKKTKGVFLKVDKPGDIHAAVTRYKRALDGRVREKVQVRGEKTVVSAAPGEEITLAPGSYTVVLPVLKGLKSDKREIKNVKIESGKSNVLKVRVRKGRALIRFTKK